MLSLRNSILLRLQAFENSILRCHLHRFVIVARKMLFRSNWYVVLLPVFLQVFQQSPLQSFPFRVRLILRRQIHLPLKHRFFLQMAFLLLNQLHPFPAFVLHKQAQIHFSSSFLYHKKLCDNHLNSVQINSNHHSHVRNILYTDSSF